MERAHLGEAELAVQGDRCVIGQHDARQGDVHRCIGQSLARAELEICLELLLSRLPGLAVAERAQDLRYRTMSSIQGLESLPVTY